jgi:hypothetical protein
MARTRSREVQLRCKSWDQARRLYERHLAAGVMVLPVDATNARGPATVEITLPDGQQVRLGATVSLLSAGAQSALRLRFDAVPAALQSMFAGPSRAARTTTREKEPERERPWAEVLQASARPVARRRMPPDTRRRGNGE